MTTTHPTIQALPQSILFDLDGTLIDSAADLGNAANTMRQRRHLPILPIAQYRPHIGSGARGILSVAFSDEDKDGDAFDALCQEFYDIYEHTMGDHTQVFDGVDALLRTLEQRGIQWGIVTNKSERFAIPLVARIASLQNAAVLICGDTTAHAKPHPLPLQEAAKRLGVDACKSIYVGDDKRDMQAGKAAGMTTIAALYGFIAEQENTSEWPKDYGIAAPIDLLKLLPIA